MIEKNILTSESGIIYTGVLKTVHSGRPAPIDFADFFVPIYGRMRAGNILNTCQSILCTAFSESARLLNLRWLLKKVHKMTNLTINRTESTLQTFYKFYKELKTYNFPEVYSLEHENDFNDIFNTVQRALFKFPITTSEDRKIKLEMAKDAIVSHLGVFKDGSTNFDTCEGLEKEAVEIINQLAGE